MRTSETTKEIFSALVKAQSEIKNLYPSSKGYGYDYVPLEKIIDMLKAILPKYGLSYTQMPESQSDNGLVGLSTMIVHESGEWIESTASFPLTDMKGVNKSQAAGAAITYFRRYGLCAAFGITGDKDVDANDNAFKKDDEEMVEAKLALEQYIQNGVFDGDKGVKKAALEVLAGTDKKRVMKCLETARGLSKKVS